MLKNKKGMSLPTVLGIVALLIGMTSTFLSYVIFQSRVVDQSLERTENYQNAIQRIEATLSIIERDRILDDTTYLNNLQSYMGVEIVQVGSIYEVRTEISSRRTLRSFFATSVTEKDTYDYLFKNTGKEDGFTLDPFITPTALISSYVPTFIEQNFNWVTPRTEFTDFESVMTYFYELSATNTPIERKPPSELQNQWDPTAWWHWLITGSVTIPTGKNLTIPNGRLLVIDGNLTLNRGATLTGNIVVNGNVTIDQHANSTQSIKGTIYAKGNVNIGPNTNFGTISDPAFIFAEGDVHIGNRSGGHVFVLADNIIAGNQGNIHVIGGVYGMTSDNIPNRNLDPFPDFNTANLYNYAIPTVISASASGEGDVVDDFVFTRPKVS